MSDILPKLFGSHARVKLLRLFLFNPRNSFTIPEALERSRVSAADARREVALLLQIKLIKKARPLRAAGVRYTLNGEFEYLLALQALLLNAPEQGNAIAGLIRRAGLMKLLVLSGVFVGEWDGQLDILIVGERINERMLREKIRRLESEIGKELRYASLSTQDFFYRLNMNDHLVKDVLDYPHRIVLDKLNIGLK